MESIASYPAITQEKEKKQDTRNDSIGDTIEIGFFKKQFNTEKNLASVPDSAFSKVISSATHIKVRKNQSVIKYDQKKCDYIFFIIKGSLVHFVNTYAGMDMAVGVSAEGNSPFCLTAVGFFTGQPSREKIIAMEDCLLLLFTKKKLELLGKTCPDCMKIYMHMVSRKLLFDYDRLNDLVSLSAEDTFMKLEKKYPGLLKKIPGKYAAQLIGITEEWMSKLKNKMASQAENIAVKNKLEAV